MSIQTILQDFNQTVVLPAFSQIQYDLEGQDKTVIITEKDSTKNEVFDTMLREMHSRAAFLEDINNNTASDQPPLDTSDKWIGYSIILSNQNIKSKHPYEGIYCQSIRFMISDQRKIEVNLLAYYYTSNNNNFCKYIYSFNENNNIEEINMADIISLSLKSIDYFDFNADIQDNYSLENTFYFTEPSPQSSTNQPVHNLVEETNPSSLPLAHQKTQDTTPISEQQDSVPENLPPEDEHPPQTGFDPHLKQTIHEFLNKFTIPENVHLFQQISDANYARLYELVDNAIKPTTPENYVAAYELAEHHAINYAFSQKPRSILEFADYFEFYQITLNNECLSKLNQCKKNVQNLAEQSLVRLTQEEINSHWQIVTLEILNQTYDDEESAKIGIFIAEVENSQHVEDPKRINSAVQQDTERTYKLISEKFGRRNSYGTREKLIFCSINASLDYEDMLFMIQHHNRTNTLRFEFETTAVLQVSKFFNELPLEEQNIGKNYVDSYLRSAKHTIENPTEPITQELDIEGNWIFVFKRHFPAEHTLKIAEARVGVTKIYGRLTLLSYAIP